MSYRCEVCSFIDEEDVFYKDDVDDMIDMLEEVYQGGQVKEESYHKLMEIFNTPVCPECDSKHSIEYFDDSDHLHPDNDLIQAEIDAEEAREMAEMSGDDVMIETTLEQDLAFVADSDATELLYQYGVIDEDEYHARMEFAEQYANY